MESTIYVKPERIRQYVIDLFGHYHVSKTDAAMIADNLIDAEIRGVTTHGLTRIPLYTEKLISGLCDAKAVPEIVKNYGVTALIDAHDGLGQVAATKAMELAIEKAEQFGVGYVGLRNGSHYGTAGYYAMMAEKRGMIGFSMTNSGAFVAPFGGVEKRLGTNPIAVALPAEKHLPILLDMATSRVSRGKLLVNMKKGEPVPDDWALAIDGSRTTDAPQQQFHENCRDCRSTWHLEINGITRPFRQRPCRGEDPCPRICLCRADWQRSSAVPAGCAGCNTQYRPRHPEAFHPP